MDATQEKKITPKEYGCLLAKLTELNGLLDKIAAPREDRDGGPFSQELLSNEEIAFQPGDDKDLADLFAKSFW